MGDKQKTLPLEKAEQLALIDLARERLGLPSPQARNRVAKFLKAVIKLGAWNDDGPVSSARMELLAAYMDVSSVSTVRRAKQDALRLNLIRVEECIRAGGRGPDRYVVHVEELARLARGQAGRAPSQIGRAPLQTDRAPSQTASAPSQIGGSYKEPSLTTKNQEPPPPAPSGEPPTANVDAWREAAEVLVSCGVRLPQTAIARAKAAGLSPADVLDLVAFWQSRSPAWDVGALYTRIVEGVAGQEVESGWPEPRAIPRPRPETPATPVGPPALELERRFGERLDQLADDERDALARSILDDGTSGGGPLLGRYVRRHQREPPDDWPPEIRYAVLRGLAERLAARPAATAEA